MDIRAKIFHTYFRLKRPMTLGVRLIAQRDDGAICLVKHTYIKGWHLPGGGVEKGETIYEAALKELREEVGLVGEFRDLSLFAFYANRDTFKGDHVALFSIKKWTQIAVNNSHEIAQSGFFQPDNLPEGTTISTKKRIAEFSGLMPPSQDW